MPLVKLTSECCVNPRDVSAVLVVPSSMATGEEHVRVSMRNGDKYNIGVGHGLSVYDVRDTVLAALHPQPPEKSEDPQAAGLAAKIARWADGDGFDGLLGTVRRDQFCLKEIWVEMLGRDQASYGQRDAVALSAGARQLGDWYQPQATRRTKYGKQRVYVRKGSDADFAKPKKQKLTPGKDR